MAPDEQHADLTDEQARWRRGEEDPLRVVGENDDWGHPLQYAIVDDVRRPDRALIMGTRNASDNQLRKLAGRDGTIERFERCPACEQWSPCSVRTAWAGKVPVDMPETQADRDAEAHRLAREVDEEAQRRDPLGIAFAAWDEAQHGDRFVGPTDRQRDLLAESQTTALLAIAENFAAVAAGMRAAMPEVLRTLAVVGKAASDALSGQTTAMRRVAELLEYPRLVVGADETIDPDEMAERWSDGTGHPLPPIEVNTVHAAERLRMKLDRVRELAESRLTSDVGRYFAQELLAILDDPEPIGPGPLRSVCPAHGEHPHDGMVCADCPDCKGTPRNT